MKGNNKFLNNFQTINSSYRRDKEGKLVPIGNRNLKKTKTRKAILAFQNEEDEHETEADSLQIPNPLDPVPRLFSNHRFSKLRSKLRTIFNNRSDIRGSYSNNIKIRWEFIKI